MADELQPEIDPAATPAPNAESSPEFALSGSETLANEPAPRSSKSWRSALLWILEEIVWLSAVLVFAVGAGISVAALGLPTDLAVLFAFHVGLLVYSVVRERAKLAEWFRPTRAALLWGIGIGVAMVLTGAIYAGLLRLAGVEIPDVASELRMIVPSRIVLIAWGAFFVPIAEELYFRGRLIDAGQRHFSTRGTVIVSAFAFALVHGVPVLIPAYLALAWLLWKARDRTGGLLAPVIAHALNNLIGLLAEGP